MGMPAFFALFRTKFSRFRSIMKISTNFQLFLVCQMVCHAKKCLYSLNGVENEKQGRRHANIFVRMRTNLFKVDYFFATFNLGLLFGKQL